MAMSVFRKESAVQLEVIMKHIPHARAPAARFRAQRTRRRVLPLSSTKIVSASFMRPRAQRQSAALSLPDRQ